MIRTSGIREVVIPDAETVLQRYLNGRSSLKPRDQRDFPRLLRIVKGLALLNCFHREEIAPKTIMASQEDIEEAFKLYGTVAASNELGLSPETYEVYTKVIVSIASENQGISRKEIQKRYYELFHRPLQDDRLRRQILRSLESAGLIHEEPNPYNKREMLVYPTVAPPISAVTAVTPHPKPGAFDAEYRGENSGVDATPTPSPLKKDEVSSIISISAAPSLSSQEDKVKPEYITAVVALDPIVRGFCPLCDRKDLNLCWQVQLTDGSRYDAVCMDCGSSLLEALRKRDEVN